MRFGAMCAAASVLLLASAPANAQFFLNFENGVEGNQVVDIAGVSFQDFNGFPSLYGDSRTGNYNTTSDDLGYGTGNFHHNGNFFVWAGPQATAQGMIVDFTENDGTWFTTGYSASSTFYVDVYHTDGTFVTFSGGANLNQPMGFIAATADAGKFIDYVVLHDTGAYYFSNPFYYNALCAPPVYGAERGQDQSVRFDCWRKSQSMDDMLAVIG